MSFGVNAGVGGWAGVSMGPWVRAFAAHAVCVCVCMRACMRCACVRACVLVHASRVRVRMSF